MDAQTTVGSVRGNGRGPFCPECQDRRVSAEGQVCAFCQAGEPKRTCEECGRPLRWVQRELRTVALCGFCRRRWKWLEARRIGRELLGL